MKKLSILDKILIAGCIALMAYSVTGCARKIVGSNSGGVAKISMSSPIASAKLAAATDHATLTITAADIDSAIVIPLDVIAGSLVGADISVPAGPNRIFTIQAFDKVDTMIYAGSITTDVTPGLSMLTINLSPTVPMVNLSPHFQQAFFYGDTLGITDQLQDTFDIEIYAHNIDSLQEISGYVDYLNGPFDYFDILRGSDLPADASFGSEGTYFNIYVNYDVIGESLTDANGNAHIATIRFYTYSDWPLDSDTTTGQLIMNLSAISSLSGDSLTTRNVYTDDAEVLLVRPAIPPIIQ